MENLLAVKCRNCKETVEDLMLLALAEDAGAKVYPSATHCTRGKEHDFSPEKQAS
jgi:hypothetical protein